jgi:hypothetical protein
MDYHMAHNDEKQASVFSHDIYMTRWQAKYSVYYGDGFHDEVCYAYL